jgi:hypothetical protein
MRLGHVSVNGVTTKRKKAKIGDEVETYTETTITLSIINAEDEVVGQLANFTGKEAISVEFGNQLSMAELMR